MGGYSLAGKFARGYWSRLFARAIYIEDPQGRGLVLVACDLWSISEGLTDRVAELLAAHPDAVARRLGREQIVLGASHTHQSPGNFSTDLYFSTFATPSPGFDRHLFEFLSHRLTEVIVAAIRARQPARAVLWTQGVAKVVRNRSLPPFLKNPEAPALLAANTWLDGCQVLPDESPLTCRAVDPRLRTLVLEPATGHGPPIALAAFFAVHGTALDNRVPLYSGDLFGAADRLGEAALRQAFPTETREPVVAFFNGAEGDVSPAWVERTQEEVRGLAASLVAAMLKPATKEPLPIESLTTRAARIGLRHACRAEAGDRRCTSFGGFPGRATLGGAVDGRSFLHAVPGVWQEGRRYFIALGPQGPKVGALTPTLGPLPIAPLTQVAVTLFPPPSHVPLAVHRLGPLVLATLPGEFTTVAGSRIATRLASSSGTTDGKVILVGLANAYANYFVTPEEYRLQHYEGSSTLFGRQSLGAVTEALVGLTRDSWFVSEGRAGEAFSYRAGFARHFGIHGLAEPPDEPGIPITNAFSALAGAPRVCWNDALPSLGLGVERVTPAVSVWVESASGCRPLRVDGAPEDDAGLDFVTLAARAPAQRSRWCVSWMVPPGLPPKVRYHLRVETIEWGSGAPCWSNPFTLDTQSSLNLACTPVVEGQAHPSDSEVACR
jgi:neutral ceramidase